VAQVTEGLPSKYKVLSSSRSTSKKKGYCSQVWWAIPVISALRRQREETRKPQASLGYLAGSCLKTQNKAKELIPRPQQAVEAFFPGPHLPPGDSDLFWGRTAPHHVEHQVGVPASHRH
jgi:hypothetical protein